MTPEALPPLGATPLVSVMIVNYNYAHFLGGAIESVLSQTYQTFEVIICDDGSADHSRAVITDFAKRDGRIRTIFKQNAGVAAALNDTYRASRGEIISMLDADDLFEPRKLENVVERFRNGGRVGTVINTLIKVDENGRRIGRIPEFGNLDRGELRDRLLASAAHWSVAPTSGISMRRECADRVFPIPEDKFRTEADGYMSTVAPLFYAVDVIDEPMTIYRVHSSNVTSSRTVDVRWCERVISAGERVFSVLSRIAAENGWQVTKLADNPTYSEMLLIRDYLQGAGFSRYISDVRNLLRAGLRVRTADRPKTLAKAVLLSFAALLPKRLGTRVIESIYLPSKAKRFGSRVLYGKR